MIGASDTVKTKLFSINRPVSQSLVVAWLSGAESCSMSDPVNTWMGDHLQASKPSRYVASHLGQLSLPSLQGSLIKSRLSGWGCVGWQVTLCDPLR